MARERPPRRRTGGDHGLEHRPLPARPVEAVGGQDFGWSSSCARPSGMDASIGTRNGSSAG